MTESHNRTKPRPAWLADLIEGIQIILLALLGVLSFFGFTAFLFFCMNMD